MTNMWGREWFEMISGFFFSSFENLGEINYGMAAVSDLKQVLSSHLLLLKSLRSYLCLEEGAWWGAPRCSRGLVVAG